MVQIQSSMPFDGVTSGSAKPSMEDGASTSKQPALHLSIINPAEQVTAPLQPLHQASYTSLRQPAAGDADIMQSSVIRTMVGAFQTGVMASAVLAQQVSAVYRSLCALGFVVADAVRHAQVGFSAQSTLTLNTELVDDKQESLCADRYTVDLPLNSRQGIPIADWQPMVFLGGVVLAETVRAGGAWLEQEINEADLRHLVERLLQATNANGLQSAPGAADSPAVTWLDRLQPLARGLSMAGANAASVAMSAELFRAGVPLMPYYGLNDLAVASVSDQSFALDHNFQCPDERLQAYFTPDINYHIDVALTLPGVRTANIEAKQLISYLFSIGLSVQCFGQLCERALLGWQQRAFITNHAPLLAQRLQQGESAARISDWLSDRLILTGKIKPFKKTEIQQKLMKVLENRILPANVFSGPRCRIANIRDYRRAGLSALDRLANTGLISSYLAQVITSGVPYISSGFNGLRAGKALKVPINVEKPVFWQGRQRAQLNISGQAVIPGSQLQQIRSTLLVPLVASSAVLKAAVTLATMIQDEGGSHKLIDALRARPVHTSAYYTSQFLLRVAQQGAAALGVFGLSLFLGARIAADLVGGSRVESIGDLEGTFAFNASLSASGRVLYEQVLDNSSFTEKIETIELPNPSKISQITMIIGGVGGGVALLASQGFNRAQQALQRWAPHVDQISAPPSVVSPGLPATVGDNIV